jgi:glutathione S-transferase
VKLHRCSWTFLHTEIDACWKVEKALKEKGIPYEVVKHGYGKSEKSRSEVIELSGQKHLPVLEMPDGEVYRAESDDMAERVRSGGIDSPPAA